MTGNQIAFWGLQESKRHNLAVEAETKRYNDLYLGEVYRHNIAGETEVNRHNLAVESETHRSNVANEAIRKEANAIQDWYNRASIGLGYSQLAYQRERDANQLAYQYAALDETTRSNKVKEQQAQSQLNELIRANKAKEQIDRSKVTQSYELGYANLRETQRYHDAVAANNERLADIQEKHLAIDWTNAISAAASRAVGAGVSISEEVRKWGAAAATMGVSEILGNQELVPYSDPDPSWSYDPNWYR